MADAFTSTEYNDVTGCVSVNVVDALMAIANAINRLAAVQERGEELRVQAELICEALEHQEALKRHDDGSGHA